MTHRTPAPAELHPDDPGPISAAARRARARARPAPAPSPLAVARDLFDGHGVRLAWSPECQAFVLEVEAAATVLATPAAHALAIAVEQQISENRDAIGSTSAIDDEAGDTGGGRGSRS